MRLQYSRHRDRLTWSDGPNSGAGTTCPVPGSVWPATARRAPGQPDRREDQCERICEE